MLNTVKCKVYLLGVATHHYEQLGTYIIPPDGTELEEVLYRSVLIPPKWAAELVYKHPLPGVFLDFVIDNIKTWDVVAQDSAKFLMDWALAACGAVNAKGGKLVSQLGAPVADYDQTTEKFDDWTEARLIQTLGVRETTAPAGGMGVGFGGVQPIF